MQTNKLLFSILSLGLITQLACAPKNFGVSPESGGDQSCNGFNQPCTRTTDGNNQFEYTVVSDEAIPQSKVDVLFVVDNSKSMAPEQQKMASRFANFVQNLNGIDWRIAVTTTDIYGDNGNLKPFPDVSTILRPSSSNPNGQFQSTVAMGENMDPRAQDERAIYAANLVVERGGPSLIRSNSHLAVVVLSDEDERSDGGGATSLDPKHDTPESFIENVKNRLGSNKSFAFHSIIIAPGDTNCKLQQEQNPNGEGKYGNVYARLSQMTGGIIGNICADDYSSQLSSIGAKINSDVKSIQLACTPLGNVVEVSYSPAQNPAITHSVNANKLVLSRTPSPGTHIKLKYQCAYTARI